MYMKTCVKNPLRLPVLAAVFGLILAAPVTAQTFKTLHVFTNIELGTLTALTLGSNVLYGTTQTGGSSGNGTLFAINVDGTGYNVLHDFSALTLNGSNFDGATPFGALVLAGNTIYGTARTGGSWGNGTVFAMSTDGS